MKSFQMAAVTLQIQCVIFRSLKFHFILFLLLPFVGFTQVIDKEQLLYKQINCDIPIRKVLNPKSIPYEFKALNGQRALNYTINYIADGVQLQGLNCSTWPTAAQTALEFAMDIWSDVLENTQNIGIDACWTVDVSGNTLAQAGSFNVYIENFNALGPTFYPTALIEHIANQSVSETDIISFFNANRTDWYFGTDANPPANMVDFVSVSIHELGHGLGFSGVHAIDDGVLDADMNHECDGTAGNGCIGFLRSGEYIPTMFDRFVDIDDASKIITLTNPSAAIATNLTGGSTTGGSGGLDFDETNENIYRRAGIKLNTPETYQPGSSYSHFDETTLPNELMSPSFTFGQAIHNPGMAQIVMEEMGWSPVTVPVELSKFAALRNESTVLLDWTTESEINSDYFEIQKSNDGKEFINIGKISAKGNSSVIVDYDFTDRAPYEGMNYYRLKQTDYDGSFDFSSTEIIEFEGQDRALTIAPNPAYNSIIVKSTEISKGGEISIFTMDGRLVGKINVEAQKHSSREINISSLPKGNYHLRFLNGNKVMVQNFIKI